MKHKKQSGKKRLEDLILDTAKKLNMVQIIRNKGIDEVIKNVHLKMSDDILGEHTVLEQVENTIIELAI